MSDLTNRVLMGVAKANTVVSVIGIAVAFGAILHNKKVREESQRTYELCKEEAARAVERTEAIFRKAGENDLINPTHR